MWLHFSPGAEIRPRTLSDLVAAFKHVRERTRTFSSKARWKREFDVSSRWFHESSSFMEWPKTLKWYYRFCEAQLVTYLGHPSIVDRYSRFSITNPTIPFQFRNITSYHKHLRGYSRGAVAHSVFPFYVANYYVLPDTIGGVSSYLSSANRYNVYFWWKCCAFTNNIKNIVVIWDRKEPVRGRNDTGRDESSMSGTTFINLRFACASTQPVTISLFVYSSQAVKTTATSLGKI